MKKITVEIKDLSHDGKGIGFLDGKPIFVPEVYPGETVEVEVLKEKKKFLEGKPVEIIKKSPLRIESICRDFLHCGGCNFCDYDYEEQLKFKSNRVKSDLKKYAKIQIEELKINKSEKILNYRNHVQLFSKNGEIGYYKKNTHEIFTPKECIIAPKKTNEIISVLKNFKEIEKVKVIGIRENYKNEVMLVFVTSTNEKLDLKSISEDLKNIGVISVYQNYNDNSNIHYGIKSELKFGEENFFDRINGFRFKISPNSFFQVNREMAEKLFNKAIEYLELKKTDEILELYCGNGSITMGIAEKVKKVTAIEYNENAIKDAKINANLNKIDNIKFIAGKAEEEIKKLSKNYNKILLDPPRTGAKPEVLEEIIKLNPEKIVYISCNPSTLARDIKILSEKGYKLRKIELYDMFLLSYHVETVVLMSRIFKQ